MLFSRAFRTLLLLGLFASPVSATSTSSPVQMWFSGQQANLSALELLSLLSDLGHRASPELTDREMAEPEKTAQYLTSSLITLSQINIGHQVQRPSLSPSQILAAYQRNTLTDLIDSQLPDMPEVLQLRAAIATMRRLASDTHWPHLAPDFEPRLGQRHPQVGALVYILQALGDYRLSDPRYSQDFTPGVVAALKQFQHRHHLPVTGRWDPPTRDRLAWHPADRLKILQKNLMRWLSLPSRAPTTYLLVNVPSFDLRLRVNQQTVFSTPVVVGAPATPTPIMLTEIDRITVNPAWFPPRSIVTQELLPRWQRAPGKMHAEQFFWQSRTTQSQAGTKHQPDIASLAALDDYRLVQAPGPANALGKWRFNIKNNAAIFLHDTPVKQVFAQPYRALSHGCVRVHNPSQLVAAILPQSAKARQFVTQANTLQTAHFTLPEPIPTYINYQTVQIVNQKRFWLRDIYHKDSPAK